MSPAPDTLYTVSDTARYVVGAVEEKYAGPILAFWVLVGVCAVLFLLREMYKPRT